MENQILKRRNEFGCESDINTRLISEMFKRLSVLLTKLTEKAIKQTGIKDVVFAGGGVYPNLMCAHPPFQIDGNFGFTAAVCEMLISADGDPLPALPPELHTGSLRGVAIKGRRFADISWRDGRLEEFKIYTK
jgi:alpha-L-fucosidase 2